MGNHGLLFLGGQPAHRHTDTGCGSSVLVDIPMEPEIRYTAVLRECAMLLQMPKGVPVATVAIGNAANAGLLALRILAASNASLQQKMLDYQVKTCADHARSCQLHLDSLHSMTEWNVLMFCCTNCRGCILIYSHDNEYGCSATRWVSQESCLQLIGCVALQCSCVYQNVHCLAGFHLHIRRCESMLHLASPAHCAKMELQCYLTFAM